MTVTPATVAGTDLSSATAIAEMTKAVDQYGNDSTAAITVAVEGYYAAGATSSSADHADRFTASLNGTDVELVTTLTDGTTESVAAVTDGDTVVVSVSDGTTTAYLEVEIDGADWSGATGFIVTAPTT